MKIMHLYEYKSKQLRKTCYIIDRDDQKRVFCYTRFPIPRYLLFFHSFLSNLETNHFTLSTTLHFFNVLPDDSHNRISNPET